jgi:metal-sulfur cluster biosynthetic enzyme
MACQNPQQFADIYEWKVSDDTFIVIAVNMTQKRMKCKALSLKENLSVIREVESNPTLTRVEVAKRLNMPVTTVKRIMGKKAFNKLSPLISLPA